MKSCSLQEMEKKHVGNWIQSLLLIHLRIEVLARGCFFLEPALSRLLLGVSLLLSSTSSCADASAGFPYCYGVFESYFVSHPPFQRKSVVSVGGVLCNVSILDGSRTVSDRSGRATVVLAPGYLLRQRLSSTAQASHVVR